MKKRVILGVAIALVGFFLIMLDYYLRVLVPSVWGVILFVLGVTIALNVNEDLIEKRRDLRLRKRRKRN